MRAIPICLFAASQPLSAPRSRLSTGALLISLIALCSSAEASMSCFVNDIGSFDAPAKGDTLCWSDAELPKSAQTIELEQGLSYMCDPSWYACSPLSGFEAGGAGVQGSKPGGFFFVIDSQFRINPQDQCCSGATFIFTFDPNAKPKAAQSPMGTNTGPPSCPIVVANPVHAGTGNNYEREVDYVGAGIFPLRFERHYNSILGTRSRRDGWRWKHTYERSVHQEGASAIVLRETGRNAYFDEIAGVWTGRPNIPARLERLVDAGGQPTGWRYTDENDAVELYDTSGRLLSITNRIGFTQSLTYDASGRLVRVNDPFGRALTLTYDTSGRWDTVTDPAGNVYRYAYNSNGNLDSVTYPDDTPGDPIDNPERQYHYDDPFNPDALTGISDENGIVFVTWGYDSLGRVTSNSRAGGADSITISYDDTAGTSTLTDALGEVRTYSFETAHDRVLVSSVSGSPCTAGCGNAFASYTYDGNGYPASQTDHNGNLTTFSYDTRGLETGRTEAVGTPEERTTTTRWHGIFRLPVFITEPGKETSFTYDTRGRLLTRTETDTATGRSRTVTNTYNPQGLLATRDGPRTDVSDVTTFTYDAQGNLIETRNALGHTSRVTAYDAHGRPLMLVDPNGLVTTLAYDARGRFLRRDEGGALTTFTYDRAGNVARTTLPDGRFLVSQYDDAHRLVAIEDNLGNRTEFTLDAAGNRIAETVLDPAASITRTRSRIYDTLNRLIREVGGAGQMTEFEYDPNGNQTAATVDPAGLGQRTTSEYDALNRLARSIDADSGETLLGYDARDNLVSVTDAEGLTTTYTYDGLDNISALSSPDTGLTQFTHDDAGNRISQTDARGVQMRFAYDAVNRLTSIAYPDATKDVVFEYDLGPNGIGRLTRMMDVSGTTDFLYDLRGNLLSETRTIGGIAYVTAYTYDAADRVLTITYPSGTVVRNTRDVLGRIASVEVTAGGVTRTLAANIRYLPFGPSTGFDYGNGIPHARDFDQDYRLIAQTAGGVQNLSLGHDAANNIVSLVDNVDGTRSQSFSYDALNRLTQAQGIYGTQEFSYDKIGNRLTQISSAGLDTYTYEPTSHRLASISGPNVTSFGYDANGNTTSKGQFTFTYDDTNRMTEALTGGILVGEYLYNGKGERIRKTTNGTTTIFHYDTAGLLIAESDELGNVLREYVYSNDQLLSVIEQSEGVPDGTHRFEAADGSGATLLFAPDTRSLALTEPGGTNRLFSGFQGFWLHLPQLSYDIYFYNGLPDSTGAMLSGVILLSNTPTIRSVASSALIQGTTFETFYMNETNTLPQETEFFYVHSDHLGTPQRITDSTGTISWAGDYEPFGNVFVTKNMIDNKVRFPGQYFDNEVSLHYNYSRNFDPGIGRYGQADPIGQTAGMALYSYANSNPLRFVDLYGLEVYPIPPSDSSNDINGRPSSVYFGGCLIAACVESGGPQSSPVAGPNLIMSFLPKIGGYVAVCSDPPPPRECTVEYESAKERSEKFTHPLYGKKGPLTYSIGAREFGVSYGNEGSLCFSIGGSYPPIPFHITENRGPIVND